MLPFEFPDLHLILYSSLNNNQMLRDQGTDSRAFSHKYRSQHSNVASPTHQEPDDLLVQPPMYI